MYLWRAVDDEGEVPDMRCNADETLGRRFG
jgi:hypothetical protein